MSEQTSVDVLLQNLANLEQLTGDRMRELIRDLEKLKGELISKDAEPRYIIAIEEAINFLYLQLESPRSRQSLEDSLKQYGNLELLKSGWIGKSVKQLITAIWQDLMSITAVSYQLQNEGLIQQYSEPLLRELNTHIHSISKNPKKDFQNFINDFEKACDKRILFLNKSEIVEDRDLIRFYKRLKKNLSMVSKNISTLRT